MYPAARPDHTTHLTTPDIDLNIWHHDWHHDTSRHILLLQGTPSVIDRAATILLQHHASELTHEPHLGVSCIIDATHVPNLLTALSHLPRRRPRTTPKRPSRKTP